MFLLGQAVGKYQILSNLGSGGFGTVFLAKDAWIEKKVAIKVPHRQSGDFDDLLHEPRLLAALDHPNIVGIVTAERTDGVFFIVMEYVQGIDLFDLLETTLRECRVGVAAGSSGIPSLLAGRSECVPGRSRLRRLSDPNLSRRSGQARGCDRRNRFSRRTGSRRGYSIQLESDRSGGIRWKRLMPPNPGSTRAKA